MRTACGQISCKCCSKSRPDTAGIYAERPKDWAGVIPRLHMRHAQDTSAGSLPTPWRPAAWCGGSFTPHAVDCGTDSRRKTYFTAPPVLCEIQPVKRGRRVYTPYLSRSPQPMPQLTTPISRRFPLTTAVAGPPLSPWHESF